MGTVVVAIQRGEQLIFPEPGTELREGDELSLLVPASGEGWLRERLGGESAAEDLPEDAPMI
jgi:Trk K+ transport system NAD-binding subunit